MNNNLSRHTPVPRQTSNKVANLRDETFSGVTLESWPAQWWIVRIVVVALLIRLILFFGLIAQVPDWSTVYSPDSLSYLAPAQELLKVFQFGVDGVPEIRRTPGFPLLLLPGLVLGNVEGITLGIQMLLSCGIVCLVVLCALLVFKDKNIAAVCGYLYAFEPLSILYSFLMLSETGFAFFLMLGIYALLRYHYSGSLRALYFSAAMIACSTYFRPVSYYLPFVLAGFIFLVQSPWKRKLQAGSFLLCCYLLLGLWQFRNNAVSGYAGFSSIGAVNWFYYQGAGVVAAQKNQPLSTVQNELGYQQSELYFQKYPDQRDWSNAQRYRFMETEGRRIAFQDLRVFSLNYVKGMLITLLDPAAVDFLKLFAQQPSSSGLREILHTKGIWFMFGKLLRESPWLLIMNCIFGFLLAAYLFFVLVSLCSRRVWTSATLLLLAVVSAYFLALSGGPNGLSRFRHPVMPFICLFAGYGVTLLKTSFQRHRQKYSSGDC